MPTISKIRFTNVVYEGGNKRYADEIFHFHGENSAIVLENGGGKTVFIQTAMQAIIPHTSLANRKAKDTFVFDDGPVHVAIEWIKNDRPRMYALTAVTIFPQQNGIDSYRYVYEYGPNDPHSIENLPFTHETARQQKRIASHAEMKEYYTAMSQKSQLANTFSSITSFIQYIEKNFQIISDEWKHIGTINSAEGDVEKFFEACPTEKALYEKLLIPTVEQSIAAFEKHQFVDIFEKHRDKFKLFKQLNAQLKEYEQIQQELSKYVEIVQILHEDEQRYLVTKRKGKAYFELITKAISDNAEKIGQLEEQQREQEQQNQHLQLKLKSYEIAVIEEKLQSLTEQYNEIDVEVSSIQAKLEEKNLLFGNLKYAKSARLLTQAEQQLALSEERLQKIDEQYSTAELLQQLDEVKAAIRGNFLTTKEKYEQQRKSLQQELRSKEHGLENEQQQHKQISLELQQQKDHQTRLDTELKIYETDAHKLANELFENEMERQRDTMELRTAWTKDSQKLDEEVVQLQNDKTKLELQKQQNEKRLQTINNELIDLKGQEANKDQQIIEIDKTANEVRTQLMDVLPRVTENTSLYLKEATLLQELMQSLEKKERQYDQKLYEERLARRYIDDYGEQQTFFADPYIAKKIAIWRQRFSYLETAVEYAMDDATFNVDFNLLAITLITTDDEKAKLEQYVLDVSQYLTYPIQIWTLTEAIAISKGEQQPQIRLVQPELWQQLSDLEAFQQWQQKAQEDADTKVQQRQTVDEERVRVSKILDKLQLFYTQYPHTIYQQLQDERKSIQAKTYELTVEKKDLNTALTTIEDQLSKVSESVSTKKQLKSFIDKKIEMLLQYDKKQREIQRVKQDLSITQQKHDNLLTQQLKSQKVIDEWSLDVEKVKDRIRSLSEEFKILVAERTHYKKVEDVVPVFVNDHYEVLQQRYNQIEQQINGINANRRNIEEQIEQQKKQIKQLQQELQHLLYEYEQLDEQFILPLDFEQQLAQLPTTIKLLKDEEITTSKKREKVKEDKNRQEGALQTKRAEIEEPVRFNIPLQNVKYQLSEEKKRLQLQIDQLKKLNAQLLKEKAQLEKIEKNMQILSAEHNFLISAITAERLTVEEENDFTYRQQHMVDLVSNTLAENKGRIIRQLKVVDDSKSQFITFCEQHVSEVRLRNTIIDGIKAKDAYEDLVKHQHDMEKTIHMSRQFTESEIKKHDEDLVQFVQRVHVHLRKVVEELKHIPRKTKVNVDGDDVPIYRFSIPEWTDEEGLAQIRARIDWILVQLEQLESRNPDEKETKQKGRKNLEEWLSTVQLLRYITQNKEWRVSCRKVMNDNRISKTYETWHRSNAWSGGEKWSKNMALFLGVLNYVAEKRQHISSKKKSRTVILDNPFGKASSDHVLSPVFFIAKQLGFQIIALTAHVEGKFLHDYFPVVYSCRLRSAVGTDKLVMDTKKTIHQAYFQDHNENAKEVIQAEQLNLF